MTRGRPGATPLTWATLTVAVLAVSGSGPLMASIAVPALAIAFWRNGMAAVILAPVATIRVLRGENRPSRRALGGCALAGVLLAAHFACWVPSLTMTSVATATALVCAQPVWAALIDRVAGRRHSRRFLVGVVAAVAGAALMTGADLAGSPRALLGDVLAVAGGALAAGYVTVGERVRVTLSTTVYTAICYGVCSLVLLVVCLLAGVRLGGYDTRDWLLLLAVTAGPQFLGHSLINRVLDALSATAVSVALLFEVPGAALLALVFLHQSPPLLAVPGIGLLLAGLILVVLDVRTSQPAEIVS